MKAPLSSLYKGLPSLSAPGRACSKLLKALANTASRVKHGVMSATCDGHRDLRHCFVLPSTACLWLLSASQRTAGALSDTFSLDMCFVKAPSPNQLPLNTCCRTGNFRSSLFYRVEVPLPSAPPAPCHRLCPSPWENSAPHILCSKAVTSSYLGLHVAESSRGKAEAEEKAV